MKCRDMSDDLCSHRQVQGWTDPYDVEKLEYDSQMREYKASKGLNGGDMRKSKTQGAAALVEEDENEVSSIETLWFSSAEPNPILLHRLARKTLLKTNKSSKEHLVEVSVNVPNQVQTLDRNRTSSIRKTINPLLWKRPPPLPLLSKSPAELQ